MAQPRYQVIERIDAGGMAEVFKANSTSLQGFQKLVAIKRILPSLTQNQRFVRMFLDEAKVSLHLSHTNTVQVFDLGIADEAYFIVMEFVDGTDLKKLVEFLQSRKQFMPVEQAVFVAIEVCKGLTHAHNKNDQTGRPLGIVHRDISPPNVLISRAGEVKITDFGLAKAKSQAEITDPGVVKGKFGYLSPEAAHGKEVDARTDVFAAGILLWEMLAGRRLFLGESDYDTLQQVRQAKVPPLSQIRSDVPRELERVLARCLARDIDQRFQTAADMAQDLAEFLFAYGKVVTSYDIAAQLNGFLDTRTQAPRSERDVAVDQAIQQELNKIVSLEQIDDLDLFLAENYNSLTDEGEVSDMRAVDGNFEDPRMWADLGFGADESAEFASDGPAAPGDGSWQEGDLQDLMTSTTPLPAQPAIDGNKPPSGHEANRGAATALAEAPQKPAPARPLPPPAAAQKPPSSHAQAPKNRPAQEERAFAVPQPGGPAPQQKPKNNTVLIVVILALLLAVVAGLFFVMGPT